MKERKAYTYKFVHWNSARQRHQNVDITWTVVDQSSGQRDGSLLHIGEDALITPVFQTLKSEISVPIDTDTCSLRSWRASSTTNPRRLKLLGLMTMLTMTGTWPVSDRTVFCVILEVHFTWLLDFFPSCFVHLSLSTLTLLFWSIIRMSIKQLPVTVYTNLYESVPCFFFGINSTLKWEKRVNVILNEKSSTSINIRSHFVCHHSFGFSLLQTTKFSKMQNVQ